MPAVAVAGGTSGGRQPAVDSTERRSAFLTLALVYRLQAAAIGHSDGADEVFSRHKYFEEDAKGSITVGKQADLVILGQNPLATDPADLEHIPILETFSRGRSVYQN